jgi:hypothetical protein
MQMSALKLIILKLEITLAGLARTKWLILALSQFFARLLWFWERIRFSALVPHRGLGCVRHWNVDLKYPQNIWAPPLTDRFDFTAPLVAFHTPDRYISW